MFSHRSHRSQLRAVAVALATALFVLGAGCGSDDESNPTTTGGPDGSDSGAVEGTVTVFAAASLTDVFTTLGEQFEQDNPGATVAFSFGPSSALVTQVLEGAPADVVATAAVSTMDDLVAGDVVDGDPVAFGTNPLELAVPAGNPGGVTELADLADDELLVGLCAEEVPCGRFAREALTGAGVEPSIDSDEQDVRALLTKLEAGELDVGIVYRTDVAADGDAVEGIAIPADQNVTATYPIAGVGEAPNAEGGRAFVDFVLSGDGLAALADAGFGPP